MQVAYYTTSLAKTTLIGIEAYRAAIGTYNNYCCSKRSYNVLCLLRLMKLHSKIYSSLMLCVLICLTLTNVQDNTLCLVYVALLLLICGDIHMNPGPQYDALSICHINVNSLYVRSDPNPSYKLDEIYSTYCIERKSSIICLSETWLNPTIPDINIELPGYILYRRDRADGYGGVAIYISKTLHACEVPELRSSEEEHIWLNVNINNLKMFIAVYYRPPNHDSDHTSRFIEDFQEQIQNVYLFQPDYVFITGDFNDRRFDWSDKHVNSDLKNTFYDFLRGNGLYQLVNIPTYITERSRPTLLDLFITDAPHLVKNCYVDPPVGSCHHCPIYTEIKLKLINELSYTRKIWLFKNANFENLNDYILGLPWYDVLDDGNVNTNVENFYKIFMDVCSYFIPNKCVQIRPRDKPWMTGHIRRLLRKRNRCYKKYKRMPSERNLEIWKAARKYVKSEMKRVKRDYDIEIKHKLSQADISSKTFWKLTKSLLGD